MQPSGHRLRRKQKSQEENKLLQTLRDNWKHRQEQPAAWPSSQGHGCTWSLECRGPPPCGGGVWNRLLRQAVSTPAFTSFLYFYALLLSSALISKTVFSIEKNVFISIRGYGNVPQKVLNLSLCRSQPPVGQSGLHTSGVGGAANTRPCPSLLLGDFVGTFRRADFTTSSCILGLFSGICKGRLGKGAPGPGSACRRVLRVSSLHSVLRDAPLTCHMSFTLKVSAGAPRQGPNLPHSQRRRRASSPPCGRSLPPAQQVPGASWGRLQPG